MKLDVAIARAENLGQLVIKSFDLPASFLEDLMTIHVLDPDIVWTLVFISKTNVIFTTY